MSLQSKAWSLLEQFGGAGIFFLTLPFVSHEISETAFGIFLMSQVLIGLATIYTGGAVLRAKSLHDKYCIKYSFFTESILAGKIVGVISPIIALYFLILNGVNYGIDIRFEDQLVISLIILLCIFFEIHSSTLSVLLKTRNIFQGGGVAEIIYRSTIVIATLLFYKFNAFLAAGAYAFLVATILKFLILYFYEEKYVRLTNPQNTNFEKNISSSLLSALTYGLTSFVVANGEKIFSGFISSRELSTVYSVILLPLFIPSIFNAIRITALGKISVNNAKPSQKSLISFAIKDLVLIAPLTLIVYALNPIYYEKFANHDTTLDMNLLNIFSCVVAATQTLNIRSFYMVISKSPSMAAKIVLFSGVVYLLIGVVLIPIYGIYGVLLAKLAFYASSLLLIPAAKRMTT